MIPLSFISLMSVIAVMLFGAAPAAPVSHCQVDLALTSASFEIAHIMGLPVDGKVPVVKADIFLNGTSTIPTSISATLDATRFSTDDSERDGVMKDPDWFDTAQFPTWSFVSTKIVMTTPEKAFTLIGNLTAHGVTVPVRLLVLVANPYPHPSYHAQGQVDRTVFGMKGTKLGAILGNTATISLDVHTK